MVLLGFIDEPKGGKTGEDDDPANWTISRIGGQPAFPSEEISNQLQTFRLCPRCQKEQIFVCQLYCPLDGHKYDRTLYLFACRNPSCWNRSDSWTAIRCQRYDETVEKAAVATPDEPPATVPSSSKDWCDDADAWNSDDNDNDEEKPSSVPKIVKKEPEVVMLNNMKIEDEDENDKSSSDDDEEEIEIETKKKSNKKIASVASVDAFHEWKKTNLVQQTVDLSSNASFPFYYIVIDEEEEIINEAKLSEQKKLRNKMKKLGNINEDDDDDDDETTKGGKEKYEKTPDIEHGDVVFYKFQQKIRYAPDQIIRYDWSGTPLILTKIDSHGFSSSSSQKCRHCHSSCVFEFQLMPALVNFLKLDKQISLEFGTVFLYTCSANCWDDQKDLYRLENVVVQADPDQNLFD